MAAVAVMVAKYRGRSGVINAFRTPCALHFPIGDGTVRAAPGDWVIIGEDGEQTLCTPEVFLATYEPLEGDEATA
jgi:hypothetical protein